MLKILYKLTLTITGGASGDSGDAGYCWTTSGLTTLNSARANATCGATVDTTTYGTTYLDMECFDDACAYTGTNDDIVMVEYTAAQVKSQERTGNMLMV